MTHPSILLFKRRDDFGAWLAALDADAFGHRELLGHVRVVVCSPRGREHALRQFHVFGGVRVDDMPVVLYDAFSAAYTVGNATGRRHALARAEQDSASVLADLLAANARGLLDIDLASLGREPVELCERGLPINRDEVEVAA